MISHSRTQLKKTFKVLSNYTSYTCLTKPYYGINLRLVLSVEVLIENQHRIQIKNGFNLSCLNSECVFVYVPFVLMKILDSKIVDCCCCAFLLGWFNTLSTTLLLLVHQHHHHHAGLAGQLLPNEHNHANVGRYMDQIRHESLIETAHAFVPPCLFDAVPGAAVTMMMILQACPHHLIWICCCGSNQLRHRCECQIFASGLKKAKNN